MSSTGGQTAQKVPKSLWASLEGINKIIIKQFYVESTYYGVYAVYTSISVPQ
jgi:hypothetical protein